MRRIAQAFAGLTWVERVVVALIALAWLAIVYSVVCFIVEYW